VTDKRNHPRLVISATARITHRDGTFFEGTARDVSMGGMFIEASSTPVFGTELTVEVKLPGEKEEVRLPAVVRWSKPDGFGVQFGLLGARETHAIAQLIRKRH
jgi:Tfp pilus assembly protein PilZ